jgi:hypothetical protein
MTILPGRTGRFRSQPEWSGFLESGRFLKKAAQKLLSA